MYLYQKTNRYFVQTADDIKDLAAQELASLGAGDIKQAYRGLYMTAAPEVMYTINFQSRLINRILAPLITFTCHTDKVLYNKAMEINWTDFLNCSQTFSVFATVSNSTMKHSKFAALRLKDAIVDYFKNRRNNRPSVDTRNPDVFINLHIENNRANISFDTSGGSLHRRGYRKGRVEAPMTETLAAAVIKLTEWNGEKPLYDPFCGSGTLLCEAFLAATNTPSAILRQNFGFERLPDFRPDLWKSVHSQALHKIKTTKKGLIAGSDISQKAVNSAVQNCGLIDKNRVIDIKKKNIFDIDHIRDATIISNPPYGIRMGKEKDLGAFYKQLGDFLKQRCQGSTAYIYFGEREYIKHIGLRPSWKKPLSNGGLDGRLVKYTLY